MRIRVAVSVILFTISLAAYSLNPGIFEEFVRILRTGNVEQIAAYLRSFGGWAVLVSIALSTLLTFGLIIPFVLISAANGMVFGLGWGTVVSWAGEVIGATIAFSVYRYCFRPSIIKRYANTEHWRYVETISGEHGFKTVLMARIFPLVPSGILTAAASISIISFGHFTWATLLGKIPSVFAKVLFGHDLIYFERYKSRLMVGLLFMFLLYAIAWWMKRRDRQFGKMQRSKLGKFWCFLHHTFIDQEKNRNDVLDYLWAAGIITMVILIAWAVMYYGVNWR